MACNAMGHPVTAEMTDYTRHFWPGHTWHKYVIAPTGTEEFVCSDIASRQRLGIAKYGVTVADNPLSLREWLQHAYEECLDQAVYLRRAISELDQPNVKGLPPATGGQPSAWGLRVDPSPEACLRAG